MERSAEIAKNLKSIGTDVGVIAQVTGLTMDAQATGLPMDEVLKL